MSGGGTCFLYIQNTSGSSKMFQNVLCTPLPPPVSVTCTRSCPDSDCCRRLVWNGSLKPSATQWAAVDLDKTGSAYVPPWGGEPRGYESRYQLLKHFPQGYTYAFKSSVLLCSVLLTLCVHQATLQSLSFLFYSRSPCPLACFCQRAGMGGALHLGLDSLRFFPFNQSGVRESITHSSPGTHTAGQFPALPS